MFRASKKCHKSGLLQSRWAWPVWMVSCNFPPTGDRHADSSNLFEGRFRSRTERNALPPGRTGTRHGKRGGLVPRKRLEERFRSFEAGEWESLVLQSIPGAEQAAILSARRRRWERTGGVEQ